MKKLYAVITRMKDEVYVDMIHSIEDDLSIVDMFNSKEEAEEFAISIGKEKHEEDLITMVFEMISFVKKPKLSPEIFKIEQP